MAKNKSCASKKRRQLLESVHGWKFELKGQAGDPCTYCGVVADTMDHVPPLHYFARMSEIGEEVERPRMIPACRECNSVLGGRLLLTVQTRRAYIKDRLRQRYKAQLRMPGWDEDDMMEMSPELARDIAANLRLREWVMQRLAWMR